MGDNEPFRLDVRVLCATNRDLRQMIARTSSARTCYFRINTFEIRLPPLRERRPDIPDLARHLLARAAKRPIEQVADLLTPRGDRAVLLELRLAGQRARAGQRDGARLHPRRRRADHAGPPAAHRAAKRPARGASGRHGPPPRAVRDPADDAGRRGGGPRTLDEIEMEHILRVLDKHNGSKPAAAAELGISLKTLYNKLNRWEEERRNVG